MSAIEEIASVLYLFLLDSADILALKVHFYNRTVLEADYEKGELAERQGKDMERTSLCNDTTGIFCADV